tara:strand:+ start:179 stop:613 length:435 start_codon:yes stop_codon:yes gene_type:complete
MIKIAHRGNTVGSNPLENAPEYIDKSLSEGYEAEIDVWYYNDGLWLGHDNPTYMVDISWLQDRHNRLWCHAKNFEALNYLLTFQKINVFWHQQDNYTVTSQGYIWAYPGQYGSEVKTIAVLPTPAMKLENFYGICSDDFTQFEI